MNRQHIVLLAALSWMMLAGAAHGQLFGERTLGRGISPRPRPGPTTEAPQLRSIDPSRFVRGQRPADAFVGARTDPNQGFVGVEQDVPLSAIRSAIDGTLPRQTVRRASQINRPLPPRSRRSVNPPVYVVAPPAATREGSAATARPALEERLQAVLDRHFPDTIQVQTSDRTVVLEGELPSERERALAEAIVGFEPGVDRVINRIAVAGP